jgi:2-oxoglutarate ferredoxin oxidoreductase subunit beta
MEQVFNIPKSLKEDTKFTFCPGCDHGVAIRLLCQAIDELEVREKAIAMVGVGCSAFLYHFLNMDSIECPHGRASAVATGAKRANPNKFIFTYQGDGDYAAIGLAESMYCGIRGEKITSFCINNTNYGMTGGQMGPTTMLGQKTTTTPFGRSSELNGYPLNIAEQIAELKGTAFSARVALDSVANINKATKIIKKACEIQIQNLGYSFVEILSGCPTNWKMTPQEAHKHVRENMAKEFPLGIFKDITEN